MVSKLKSQASSAAGRRRCAPVVQHGEVRSYTCSEEDGAHSPDVEVYGQMGIPVYDVDFGAGGRSYPSRNQRPAMDDDGPSMSINDEIRLMGGVGDDEENLQAGREELFGRNANAPIDLVDAGDGEGDAGVAGSAAGVAACGWARLPGDGRYFRSFVDFARSGVVEWEGLVRTAVSPELVARTNLEVDSVLGIPFYDLDFGTGRPFLFAPTYSTPQPVEGAAFLVPAAPGDGGVVAHVPLYRRNVDAFTSCCHSLAPPVPGARL
ncbi:hypothetical protein C2845_PMPSC049115 [Panicum miliaceum]|uniref:Uncharacterized protein n=1 Tax=Panicum miliaceum TaxID=4540 RepID=A0A3L6PB13_PANMI|nr:hypothetical protein C2845_PMPSC049115 [Panicum miliaceum]